MKPRTTNQPSLPNRQRSRSRFAAGFVSFFTRLVLLVITLTGSALADPPTFEVLKRFGIPPSGTYPAAGLVQGTDGAFYGTARDGGSFDYGTAFKVNADGSGFTVLVNFDYSTTGSSPQGGLVQGTDGAFYGTARDGGSSVYGTAFKVNADGSGFTVLKNFDNSTTGGFPAGVLVKGTDGAFYGTASQGGISGYGTAFKVNADGSDFSVLKNFDYDTTGSFPAGVLVKGTDGAFYGTARSGGSSGYGTAFKMNADGGDFTVIQNFDGPTTGSFPAGGLVQGTDGVFYGTASQGGTYRSGTVFKLNADGSGFAVLKYMNGSVDTSTEGGNPTAGLVQGTDGAFYGTAQIGGREGYGQVFEMKEGWSGFNVRLNMVNSTAGG